MATFVSKSRRVKFTLTLHILDLNNVPLVSGTSFIKWHLPSSTAAEHRGRTDKCPIRDHRVLYNYEKTLPVRLAVGKDGMLQTCEVQIEVVQEYSAGGRAERIVLGRIGLNLAEYVEASDQVASPGGAGQQAGSPEGSVGEHGVVRRYLMKNSKINSTLKIGIHMRQTEGTHDYSTPPLRTAPVFGGIAGIISSSEPVSANHGNSSAAKGDADSSGQTADDGPVPSLSTTNREMGEMQDMYRRTLAAYLTSQPGEMRADECIEDLFSGGDGWGKHGRPAQINNNNDHSASGSGSTTPNPDGGSGGDTHHHHGIGGGASRPSKMAASSTGRGPMGMLAGAHHRYGKYGAKVRMPKRGAGEVDEFDVREDLRSWRIGEKACT